MNLQKKLKLKQWAVRWPFIGQNENGIDQYGDPEEVRCRWTDKVERDVSPVTGQEVLVRSTVWVSEDMNVGDVLWLGLLVDSPSTPPVHNKIKVWTVIPDKKGRSLLRTAKL